MEGTSTWSLYSLMLLLLLCSSLFASIGGGGGGSCSTSMCMSNSRPRRLFRVCSTYRRGLATWDGDVDDAGCAFGIGRFAASMGKTWDTSLHSAVAHGLRLRGGLQEQQGGIEDHESIVGSKEKDEGRKKSKEVSKKRPRPKRKTKAIGGGSQLRMYKHVTDAAEELVVYSFLQEEVLKNAKGRRGTYVCFTFSEERPRIQMRSKRGKRNEGDVWLGPFLKEGIEGIVPILSRLFLLGGDVGAGLRRRRVGKESGKGDVVGEGRVEEELGQDLEAEMELEEEKEKKVEEGGVREEEEEEGRHKEEKDGGGKKKKKEKGKKEKAGEKGKIIKRDPTWRVAADHVAAARLALAILQGGDLQDGARDYIAACKARYGGVVIKIHAAALSDGAARGERRAKAMRDLMSAAKLDSIPRRIEGIDISHMQGMGAVASVSVLVDGLECPREYRWYRITNETIRTGHSDDYASISEVIGARFTSGMVGGGGGGKRPDLLMIDGGRGQLHSAMAALKAANATDTPVVALAKQREEIWSPISSSPLPLPPNEPACMLLRLCRDEAHALALYYHRHVRSTEYLWKAFEAARDGARALLDDVRDSIPGATQGSEHIGPQDSEHIGSQGCEPVSPGFVGIGVLKDGSALTDAPMSPSRAGEGGVGGVGGVGGLIEHGGGRLNVRDGQKVNVTRDAQASGAACAGLGTAPGARGNVRRRNARRWKVEKGAHVRRVREEAYLSQVLAGIASSLAPLTKRSGRRTGGEEEEEEEEEEATERGAGGVVMSPGKWGKVGGGAWEDDASEGDGYLRTPQTSMDGHETWLRSYGRRAQDERGEIGEDGKGGDRVVDAGVESFTAAAGGAGAGATSPSRGNERMGEVDVGDVGDVDIIGLGGGTGKLGCDGTGTRSKEVMTSVSICTANRSNATVDSLLMALATDVVNGHAKEVDILGSAPRRGPSYGGTRQRMFAASLRGGNATAAVIVCDKRMPYARGADARTALDMVRCWLSTLPSVRARAAAEQGIDTGGDQEGGRCREKNQAGGEVVSLSEEQQRAVTAEVGSVLVLAGPGSGKTCVLAHRIRYLMGKTKCRPSSFLALTFTNKAASELRNRLESLMPGSSTGMLACTFHSFGARLLRMFGRDIGVEPTFTILSAEEQKAEIMAAAKSCATTDSEKGVSQLKYHQLAQGISRLRASEHSSASYSLRPGDELLRPTYKEYTERLRRSGCLDFDQLVYRACELLSSSTAAISHVRSTYKHILVDEFQDSDPSQLTLITLLAPPASILPHATTLESSNGGGGEEGGRGGGGGGGGGGGEATSIFVVGDSDQSIYGWRGADVSNTKRFSSMFGIRSAHTLENNFRSTRRIASVAQALIEGGEDGMRDGGVEGVRTTRSVRGDGDKVRVFEAQDDEDEAHFVSSEIQRIVKSGQVGGYSEVAVMYRANSQGRSVEGALVSMGVPYRMLRARGFYERKEVRDLVSYLRLLVNPNDSSALMRIINTPPRGIGGVTITRLAAAAEARNVSVPAALSSLADADVEGQGKVGEGWGGLKKGQVDRLVEFETMLRGVRGRVEGRQVSQILDDVLGATGFKEVFEGSGDGEGAGERWASVLELKDAAIRVTEAGVAGLSSFLEAASLDATDTRESGEGEGTDGKSGSGVVSVMTVHASKGLEFGAVFLVGMEEGTFPHARSLQSAEGLQEERRLAYVAFTRARDILTLSFRARLKTSPRAPTSPSRFLSLPPQLTQRILHNGNPYAAEIADRTVIVLTRCALGDKARSFLQRSNVTVVDWGGLENIAKGRPLRKSSARTVMFRPGAGDNGGDKRGPRAAEFELASPFEPTGDQPQAITELVGGLQEGRRFQTLLGATGTGKTFVMANLINSAQKPTLVLAPNKMLAAQLCNELRDFFPRNAVEYFVSYYDFFRPEAYMAVKDVYVEKASVVNQVIDRMRHSATRSLFERRDTIVVSSVSCIYGLGMPTEYMKASERIRVGDAVSPAELGSHLDRLQYQYCMSADSVTRGGYAVDPGLLDWDPLLIPEETTATGSVTGSVSIGPSHSESVLRVHFAKSHADVVEGAEGEGGGGQGGWFWTGGEGVVVEEEMWRRAGLGGGGWRIIGMSTVEPVDGDAGVAIDETWTNKEENSELDVDNATSVATLAAKGVGKGGENWGETGEAVIYPATHFVTPESEKRRIVKDIRAELKHRVAELEEMEMLLEAHRLLQKTEADLAQINKVGYCRGVENYARHLTGRSKGEPPDSLIDYFPPSDWLLLVDESHISVPQLRGMFYGDRARKEMLVRHGFRLPSALDNRPLKEEEFWGRVPQCVFVSATPGEWELERSSGGNRTHTQLIIRPTGIVDPVVECRPSEGQITDVVAEIRRRIDLDQRTLITTLTKRMAEEVCTFLNEQGIKAAWLHSEVKAMQRLRVVRSLREGKYSVLVGVNLLREGLDLPEVSLVAILDADKEGFLRSDKSLVQTIGRASRHVNGTVLLYCDRVTASMVRAMSETSRRRSVQEKYNLENNVTPRALIKGLGNSILDQVGGGKGDDANDDASRPKKGWGGRDRGGGSVGGDGRKKRGKKGAGAKKIGAGERLTEVADDILTVLERLDGNPSP